MSRGPARPRQKQGPNPPILTGRTAPTPLKAEELEELLGTAPYGTGLHKYHRGTLCETFLLRIVDVARIVCYVRRIPAR